MKMNNFFIYKKVAFRWRQASTHRKSLSLMYFLSDVTKKIGVSDHVYVVGGAVRNYVIDQPIKDIDVMVDTLSSGMSSEELGKKIARHIPAQVNVVTNQYGVTILTVSSDWFLDEENLKGEVIEIAEARKESYSKGGWKPSKVEPGTIEEDIYRREFTFNTLMWRLSEVAKGVDKAKIIDITGCGLKDLASGEMRCPSNPDKTFSDDPSRMVRAVKFLVKYDFTIPSDIKRSIRRNSELIKNIPPGALSNLLITTIFADPRTAKKSLLALHDLGLISPIRDIILTNKSFASTLENWSSHQSVLFMFDLIDIGLPLRTKLDFLSKAQQEKLRANVVSMDRQESIDYLNLLKQPVRALRDKKFIPMLLSSRNIKKTEIRFFMQEIVPM